MVELMDSDMEACFEQANQEAEKLIVHLNNLVRKAGWDGLAKAREEGKI